MQLPRAVSNRAAFITHCPTLLFNEIQKRWFLLETAEINIANKKIMSHVEIIIWVCASLHTGYTTKVEHLLMLRKTLL